MNDGFRQRLVGAVVLVSIALILWPVIFSDGINPAFDRHSQVPATPAFEKYTVPAAVRPDNIEPIVRPQPDPIPDSPPAPAPAAEPVVASNPPPRLNEQRLPESWVLQIASFSQQENAEELKQALLKLGHKAYTRTVSSSGGTSTRVYVGPRMTRQAFERDQQAIDKAFAVKSMVIRFEQ